MTGPVHRKARLDPRSKTGGFSLLFREIQTCKGKNTCPALKTRQFYFEPNHRTAGFWREQEFWNSELDYRVMFVCESPGPSADQGKPEDVEPCFYGSSRDRRFMEVRKKYGLANCYMTNTVKCGVRNGGRHSPAEVGACSKFLERELHLIEPQVIVGVGVNAFQSLRKFMVAHLDIPPILFQITHYSSRRNPWVDWDREFPELLRLLGRLRPRRDWTE